MGRFSPDRRLHFPSLRFLFFEAECTNTSDTVLKSGGGSRGIEHDGCEALLIGTGQTVLFLKVVNECNLNNADIEASGVKEGDFSPSQPPDSLIPKVP